MRTNQVVFLGWMAAIGCLGCSDAPVTGEVSGMVQVDGQTPAAGSSITFIPEDGKSPTAGAVLDNGRYSAQVAVGPSKVEIRVPRPSARTTSQAGPGAGGGLIEESLPAKYNDQTELRLDVQPGKNEKNYDLKTK